MSAWAWVEALPARAPVYCERDGDMVVFALRVGTGSRSFTVAAVAHRAGLQGWEANIDARELPEGAEDLADAVDASSVFGRVTPHQKRAMVKALQSRAARARVSSGKMIPGTPSSRASVRSAQAARR